MSGKSYPEFQWTDDKIQLLLEATQNLKVEEDYKKITRFCPRPTVSYQSYVLMFLNSVVSFSKKTFISLSIITKLSLKKHFINNRSFLFSFKLQIIPSYRSSYHFQNRSVPTPLRYENHAEKNICQWKQKAYPIWKLERSHSDPVWWKHSINFFKLCFLTSFLTLSSL